MKQEVQVMIKVFFSFSLANNISVINLIKMWLIRKISLGWTVLTFFFQFHNLHFLIYENLALVFATHFYKLWIHAIDSLDARLSFI